MEKLLGLGRCFLSGFAAIFTGVMLAAAVFIRLYGGGAGLPLRLVAQAAGIAAASALLGFIFRGEAPAGRRGMALRTAVHFAALLALVWACAEGFGWLPPGRPAARATLLLLFLAVYAAVWLAAFTGDLLSARSINRRLQARRNMENLRGD